MDDWLPGLEEKEEEEGQVEQEEEEEGQGQGGERGHICAGRSEDL